jgi:hypothetical protein
VSRAREQWRERATQIRVCVEIVHAHAGFLAFAAQAFACGGEALRPCIAH